MKYTKYKLKNGIQYILAPMNNTQAVMTMVLVGTGSLYENKKNSGLAHFLEHMCFKGTTRRPSSAQISEELDDLGAQSNAFTSNNSTGYWAKGHKKDAVKLLDIVADLYLDPIFPETEIEKEKGVVIQEINMYEDDPRSKLGRVTDELLFGDQAAGRQIIGTKETVSSFTREDLVRYRATHYVPANTVVVVAGAFNSSAVKKHIEKYFATPKKAKSPEILPVKIEQKSPKVLVTHQKTDQTHFYLSFHAVNMFDKRTPAIDALSSVLGESMSSRLFKKMREELGICYYIGSGNQDDINAGIFNIYAGVATDRLEEAIKGIVEEIKKIKNAPITKEELDRSKNINLTGLALGLETSGAVASRCAYGIRFRGKVRSIEESTKRIKGVTIKQVHDAAQFIFDKNKANLSIIGPHTGGKVYEEKLKKLLDF